VIGVSVLDLALVALFVANLAMGILAGFTAGALRLLSGALALGGWLALASWAPSLPVLAVAAVAVALASSLLTGWLARRFPVSSRVDRAMGVLPGAVWGVLVAYTVAWLAGRAYPLSDSPLARGLLAAGRKPVDTLLATAPVIYGGQLHQRSSTPPGQLERQMLDLVNQERRKAKLDPLVWSDDLAALARARSKDLLARNYFAHVDPSGHAIDYYARKAHVRYLALGENLAFAPDLAIAHQGLMNSPGHRENILRPTFGHVGIGIIRLPPGTRYLSRPITPGSLMITQVFRD
jgi:hypothetical protein